MKSNQFEFLEIRNLAKIKLYIRTYNLPMYTYSVSFKVLAHQKIGKKKIKLSERVYLYVRMYII